MQNIIITNSIAAATAINPTHTVEAEYGAVTVEGSLFTLAHHGTNAANPCPCLGDNLPSTTSAVVLVSHFDLDTLGGVARCLGWKEWDGHEEMFWKVTALVDTMGVHKLEEIKNILKEEALDGGTWGSEYYQQEEYFFSCEWEETITALQAFWAWSEKNRLFAPRDGSAEEVMPFFKEACRIVTLLLEGGDHCPETKRLIKAGQAWAKAKETLNGASFKGMIGEVIVRTSESFVNHLYTTPEGKVAKAVANLNTNTGAITISLSDPTPGVSCVEIVQSIWGKEAGGHAGIAGTPRSMRLTQRQLHLAAEAMAIKLGACKQRVLVGETSETTGRLVVSLESRVSTLPIGDWEAVEVFSDERAMEYWNNPEVICRWAWHTYATPDPSKGYWEEGDEPWAY